MLKHHNLRTWEKQLKEIFSNLDIHLEDKYGKLYPLQPNRPVRGTTANNAYDGLFDVGASFSLGKGTWKLPEKK